MIFNHPRPKVYLLPHQIVWKVLLIVFQSTHFYPVTFGSCTSSLQVLQRTLDQMKTILVSTEKKKEKQQKQQLEF